MDTELLMAISQLMDEKLEPLMLSQAKLEKGQAKLEEGQAKLEKRQTELENGQAELREDMDFVKGRLILFEANINNKFNILMDGYTDIREILDSHTLRFVQLEERMDRLETTVGVHDIKLTQLAK